MWSSARKFSTARLWALCLHCKTKRLTEENQNDEYVLWFHSDNSEWVVCFVARGLVLILQHSYGAAMVGVATASTPCGPYTYLGSWQPLGAESRDEGIFLDGMEILSFLICWWWWLFPFFRWWYVFSSPFQYHSDDTIIAGTAYLLYASDNNQNFKISMLSADYLNVTEQVSIMDGKEGYLFLFASINKSY